MYDYFDDGRCHRDGCNNWRSGNQRRWCSEACRKSANRPPSNRTCRHCGDTVYGLARVCDYDDPDTDPECKAAQDDAVDAEEEECERRMARLAALRSARCALDGCDEPVSAPKGRGRIGRFCCEKHRKRHAARAARAKRKESSAC